MPSADLCTALGLMEKPRMARVERRQAALLVWRSLARERPRQNRAISSTATARPIKDCNFCRFVTSEVSPPMIAASSSPTFLMNEAAVARSV